jgi:hypothetical protein
MMTGSYKFEEVEVTVGPLILFASGVAELQEDPPFADYGCIATTATLTGLVDDGDELALTGSIAEQAEVAVLQKLNADNEARGTLDAYFAENVRSQEDD